MLLSFTNISKRILAHDEGIDKDEEHINLDEKLDNLPKKPVNLHRKVELEAEKKVDKITEENPNNIFIMFGMNDILIHEGSVRFAEDYAQLIHALEEKLPEANELAIIKVKDIDKIDTIEVNITSRIEVKSNAIKDYLPD